MTDTVESLPSQEPTSTDDLRWIAALWLIVGFVTFAICAVVAYELSFDGPLATVLTIVPWFVLAGMTVVLLQPYREMFASTRLAASIVAVAGWGFIVLNDDRWTILTFALYAVCYGNGPVVGTWFGALVSVLWATSWLISGSPVWSLTFPIGVFMVGSLIAYTIGRADRINASQADLIRQLQETRRDLAVSERSAGILEERARFAGEIHDTLAQGFTSIILLSRAAQRGGDGGNGLSEIEETATENLEAARRLIEAIKPQELESGSLADAIERHRASSFPPEISSRLRVTGTPKQLAGAVEVTLLRATQEALLNVRTHSEAGNVDITLSYLDDVVALDIRDDGIGFCPGATSDRGSMTGGQGLDVLERRVRSLGGELTIEAMDGGGSVVSIQLPAVSSAGTFSQPPVHYASPVTSVWP